MARDINVCAFSGNLTRDAEVNDRETKLSFTVAVNEDTGNEPHTNFIPCVILGERGVKALRNYLVKGRGVSIQGRIQVRQYEKDGQRRTWFEVIADRVKFNDNRGGSAATATEEPIIEDIDTEDVPF